MSTSIELIFTKLTNDNYLLLQKNIELINPKINLSALYLNCLKFYGFNIYFKINEDSIYFFYKIDENLKNILQTKNESLNLEDQSKKENYVFLRPVAVNEEQTHYHLNLLIELSKKFYEKANIYFDYIRESDLNLFSQYKCIEMWNINLSYLYENNQLKYFIGKKMQKKRNFLNYYNNNFLNETKIIKYDSSFKKVILNFCYHHISNTSEKFRHDEFESIKNLLNLFDSNSNITGSILFYKNEVIGVTMGYSHLNYYEIFLEKASRNLKGSYQFLLSKNLILNNIENPFIDRQDSESEANLVTSKKSYKPIEIINVKLMRIEYELTT